MLKLILTPISNQIDTIDTNLLTALNQIDILQFYTVYENQTLLTDSSGQRTKKNPSVKVDSIPRSEYYSSVPIDGGGGGGGGVKTFTTGYSVVKDPEFSPAPLAPQDKREKNFSDYSYPVLSYGSNKQLVYDVVDRPGGGGGGGGGARDGDGIYEECDQGQVLQNKAYDRYAGYEQGNRDGNEDRGSGDDKTSERPPPLRSGRGKKPLPSPQDNVYDYASVNISDVSFCS